MAEEGSDRQPVQLSDITYEELEELLLSDIEAKRRELSDTIKGVQEETEVGLQRIAIFRRLLRVGVIEIFRINGKEVPTKQTQRTTKGRQHQWEEDDSEIALHKLREKLQAVEETVLDLAKRVASLPIVKTDVYRK